MKKIILLLAMAMTLTFVGCSEKNEAEEPKKTDPREKYVGTYSLDVSGVVYVTNGVKTIPFDMGATDKTLKIELDKSDNSKLKVSGFYGNVSATVSGGGLCIEEYTGTTYTSGTYFVLTATHNKATLENNNTLSWKSTVEIAGVGSSTLYGSGTVYNTATK